MFKEKYRAVIENAGKLGVAALDVHEEGGKLHLKGKTTYQLEKDLLWDEIKKHPGWEQEVSVDIRTERDDIHGMYTVQAGDTLSKIAKIHLDAANRYMEIFNANKDKLKSPDLIHPGQVLVIPKR